MMIEIARHVPPERIVVFHALLGDVEWDNALGHIHDTIAPGVHVVTAAIASGKTLLDRVRERGAFPSRRNRFCTSEFKTGPIEREIRRYLRAHPHYNGRVVSMLGLRAQESPHRAAKPAWQLHPRANVAGRTWHTWLPLHRWQREDVFAAIARANQRPHPIYEEGLSRFSCSFCIFANPADLTRAARLRPALYREYCALERTCNSTLSISLKTLPEITGIRPTALPNPYPSP